MTNNDTIVSARNTIKSMAGLALAITSQDWDQLGLGDDPQVAASDRLDVTTERVTALLLIRVIAWISPRAGQYTDLSTTTICRTLLIHSSNDDDDNTNNSLVPPQITMEFIANLKEYVHRMLKSYQDVPYHNFRHCYHVVISVNKMMDMAMTQSPQHHQRISTFGLRDDPLMQLALLFAALIHDVEHPGVPNRQLADEDDLLALQYNDQSIIENRSLYLAFAELLKDDFDVLRKVLFPIDYRRFRKAVINLVLTTDIASPERTQIGKSRWKEAFGDPYETVERKIRKHMERRRSMVSTTSQAANSPHRRASRRLSTHSIMSELTIETSGHKAAPQIQLDDDESVTDTPDSSQRSEDGDEIIPVPAEGRQPRRGKKPGAKVNTTQQRNTPSRTRSMDAPSFHSTPNNTTHNNMAVKYHRRLSNVATTAKPKYQRLGLLRTVDLSGKTIETYSKSQEPPRSSATGAMTYVTPRRQHAPEDVDELRETVVMEQILKAADVAHNLQGWKNLQTHSDRLYLELRRAHVQGREDNPQHGWFGNQIGFLENYLLPLARRLEDIGIFGEVDGGQFVRNVEANRDRWMKEGMQVTTNIVKVGETLYPE